MPRTDMSIVHWAGLCGLVLAFLASPVQAQVFDIQPRLDNIDKLLLPQGGPARCEHETDGEALGLAGLGLWLDVEMATRGDDSKGCLASSNGNIIWFEVGPEPWRVGTACVLHGEDDVATGPESHSGAGFDSILLASIWPEELIGPAPSERGFVAQSECRLHAGSPLPPTEAPSLGGADACLQPGRYVMDYALHARVDAGSTASGDVVGWTRARLFHGTEPGAGPGEMTSGVMLQVLGPC